VQIPVVFLQPLPEFYKSYRYLNYRIINNSSEILIVIDGLANYNNQMNIIANGDRAADA
jgi:hypothetical protein